MPPARVEMETETELWEGGLGGGARSETGLWKAVLGSQFGEVGAGNPRRQVSGGGGAPGQAELDPGRARPRGAERVPGGRRPGGGGAGPREAAPRRGRGGSPGGGARAGAGAGGRGGGARSGAGGPGMASMAAAIAASRSAVMSGNRPLDDRERKRFTYFSSLSPMARKIMQDKEKIREKYGPEWARLPPAQQDEIIDRCLVGQRASPPAHAEGPGDAGDPARFPGLRGPTGQKLVRFGDEDITWQDEHSAPFSWETRSQMEFSISSLSIQEPGTVNVASEPRPVAKPPQSSRSSSLDALGPARKDEEASFWKINAERSREGPEAEFQSLTPSQIKSMEKGEKVLPACYRQEPSTKDREARATPHEQRAPPSESTEQEAPQPVQTPASSLPKATPTKSPEKPPSPTIQQDEEDDALFSEPSLAQVSSSNVLLKTGFDFLDNW